jgi:predicted transcriptional regulator
MTVKERVIELIRRFPEATSVEDFIAEREFRRQVEEGLRELDAGQGIPHDEVRVRLSRWLKEPGRRRRCGSCPTMLR